MTNRFLSVLKIRHLRRIFGSTNSTASLGRPHAPRAAELRRWHWGTGCVTLTAPLPLRFHYLIASAARVLCSLCHSKQERVTSVRRVRSHNTPLLGRARVCVCVRAIFSAALHLLHKHHARLPVHTHLYRDSAETMCIGAVPMEDRRAVQHVCMFGALLHHLYTADRKFTANEVPGQTHVTRDHTCRALALLPHVCDTCGTAAVLRKWLARHVKT